MIQDVLLQAESRAFADREAGAPAAGSFEGGSPALSALLVVVLISTLAALIAWFAVEESHPELGS